MRKLRNEELDRKTADEFRQASKLPVILVLDNVRSMNNVGSVFRSADAFLLEGIYLCGFTPVPPHREIQKTALGATETVAWKHVENTNEAVISLKNSGYRVFAIEQAENSISLNDFTIQKNQPVALIFGNEVEGVQQEVIDNCDGVIEIDQSGTKHSLNIAVTAGILAWEMHRQLKKEI